MEKNAIVISRDNYRDMYEVAFFSFFIKQKIDINTQLYLLFQSWAIKQASKWSESSDPVI